MQGEDRDLGQAWKERFSGITASSISLFQLKTKHLPCLDKLESIRFVSGVRGFCGFDFGLVFPFRYLVKQFPLGVVSNPLFRRNEDFTPKRMSLGLGPEFSFPNFVRVMSPQIYPA